MDDKNGGKVINSGGFGCIFLPEIICKNKSKQNKTKKISKMMLNRHASEEYEQIMKIKEIIKAIPKYGDFFVIKNINICKINKLTKEDLQNYDEKCSALQKYNITKKNINKSLNKISIVNIPYAGISIDKYIENNFSIIKVMKLNNLLINLFKKAVIPMNNLGVYHSDIKSSNILINDSEQKVRFIDWGLTLVHPKKYFDKIPSKWRNRPFQFNVPFEVVLFTDDFVSQMNSFISAHDNINNKNKEDNRIFKFVNEYIYYWLNDRGKGHLNYIHNILEMLGIIKKSENDLKLDSETKAYTKTKKQYIKNFEKYKETIDYITHYIVYILANFTEFDDNGSFSMINYINKVYKNNVDIWGFLITYIPIIEVMYENKSVLNSFHEILYYSLQKILIKYLYTPKIEMYDNKAIIKELKLINKILKNFNKNENNSKIIKSSMLSSSIQESPETIL